MKTTTKEQGKRLIELGIDPKTADFHFVEGNDKEIMTAWTLSALLELMPCSIIYEYDVSWLHLQRLFNPAKSEWAYLLSYEFDGTLEDDGIFYRELHHTGMHAEPVDAAVEMVEWLAGKGYTIKDGKQWTLNDTEQ